MTVPIVKAYAIWSSAVERYQDWRERRRAFREVEGLDPRERSRLLRDVGMTTTDFSTAMRHAFASRILLPKAFKASAWTSTSSRVVIRNGARTCGGRACSAASGGVAANGWRIRLSRRPTLVSVQTDVAWTNSPRTIEC